MNGAAEGGSILDDKGRNVPNPRTFTRKHYMARARIRDAMRVWTRDGRRLWWATLTSSPSSPKGTLRRDFQVWRKRVARAVGLEAGDLHYVMVDTREGHGVLHFVLAFPGGYADRLDYSALGSWWEEIHGARQVKFLPVAAGDGSVRRLSHYLIAQYMVVQGGVVDLLGRISTSRFSQNFAAWRSALRSVICSRAAAYAEAHRHGGDDAFFVAVRRSQFVSLRTAWDSLLSRGWCDGGGERWVLNGRQLEVM